MSLFSDYVIVNGGDTRRESAQADLVRKITEYLREGWIPLGGVVYLGTETQMGFTCHVYCQAMAKASSEDAQVVDTQGELNAI